MSESANIDPSKLRRNYGRGALRKAEVANDPIVQFEKWFAEAHAGGVLEPNAMTVATADASGKPSARTILMKGFDQRGFVFYTNYDSRKGRELDANPRAALLFFWPALERQVRIEGEISKVSQQESEEYFHSRPRDSQIGALASQQSQTIASREELENRHAQIEKIHSAQPLPLPEYWGGYRLKPQAVEFWQGRPGRLHDRLLYERQANGSWRIGRLQP
jgi:pyridoxamine 5'-phosphate oxidase